jgi:formyl-CoA transferase
VKQIGSPMRLSATPVAMKGAGPLLGEHSAQVLAEIGYTQEEIRGLASAGVIKEPA